MSFTGCTRCASIRRDIEVARGNPYFEQLAESNYRLHMKVDHGVEVGKP